MPKRIVILLTLFTMLGGAGGSSGAQVFVELVPDPPGPYATGQHVTVHVWLHSSASEDVRLDLVSFDFTDSDPALEFDATFEFDFSTIESGRNRYTTQANLPTICTWNTEECLCPEDRFLLVPGGSLHIGSIGVTVPELTGQYRLDVVNADESNYGCDTSPFPQSKGAVFWLSYTDLGPFWTAFTGEITGGTLDLNVVNAIPAVSAWGTVIFALLLLAAGMIMLRSRGAGIRRVAAGHSGPGTMLEQALSSCSDWTARPAGNRRISRAT